MDFHCDYVAHENNIEHKRFDHRAGSPYNAYRYDDIDRLAGVTYLNSDTESFVMDDLGNRTGPVAQRDGTHTYAPDPLTNRYTAIDAAALAYDRAGNLTTDKDGYLYAYDYENRIVEIRNSAGTLVAAFDYDPQGRRIRVHDAMAPATTLYYYSDTWQVLSEYDPSGSQQAYYVYGNYIDEALLMHRGGADCFYLHDHLYSPAALLDATGTVIERYEYDAYGKATIWNSDFTSSGDVSQFGNPYTFTGRRLDSMDAGYWTLMYYRKRGYSPAMGRFIQHDPLGMDPVGVEENPFDLYAQYSNGSINLFEYVLGNTNSYTDPYGTVPVPVEREFKEMGYKFWRTFMVTEPHWRDVLDDWYYEVPPPTRDFIGIGDPRCSDINSNIGFQKLLKCWAWQKYSGGGVKKGSWKVTLGSIFWHYDFDRSESAGGHAAYNSTTEFLGSYTANIRVLDDSTPVVKVEILVKNTSGWTSATRLPGFARKILGGRISLFTDHARGGARYIPSTGGNMDQTYTFETKVHKCSRCVLP